MSRIGANDPQRSFDRKIVASSFRPLAPLDPHDPPAVTRYDIVQAKFGAVLSLWEEANETAGFHQSGCRFHICLAGRRTGAAGAKADQDRHSTVRFIIQRL